MKSGVPWHVIGVGQEAQETAQEAARRSGMSVGEWLDSVIIDSAQTAGVPDKAGVGDDAQYPDHARPRRRSYSDYDERHRRHAEDELDEVHDRLDALYRQLDRVENTSSRSEREREKRRRANSPTPCPGSIGGSINSLSGAAFTAPAMAARPGPAARPQAGVAADPPTPLDQALVEIAERQRTLDSDAAPPTLRAPTLPRAPTQGLSAFEQQLRNINRPDRDAAALRDRRRGRDAARRPRRDRPHDQGGDAAPGGRGARNRGAFARRAHRQQAWHRR